MALKAVAFRVLLKVKEVEKEKEIKTDSGLVVKLAMAVDEKLERQAYTEGTIVDIGEDAYAAFKPTTQYAGLKVGDRVYFAKYAGKWIDDPDTKESFLVVNDEDIVAKVA